MTLERACGRLRRARTIGIVRTDHLGDMVLTLPLVRALREEFSTARIVIVAHSRTAPLIEGSGVADVCMYTDRMLFGDILRTSRFDALFFAYPRPEHAWLAWRAGVPLRVGTAYRWWSVFYNVRIRDHRSQALFHEAEYNVRMLEYIVGKRFRIELVPPPVLPDAREEIEQFLAVHEVSSSDPLVVLHPGGRGSAPRWDKFPQLALLLEHQLPNYRIVVTGSDADVLQCAAITAAVPSALNTCGRFSLDRTIALLARADVVVANSTGILHIATALGRAVVGLYPSEPPALSPARWGPLGSRCTVFAAMPITSIAVEDVATAACHMARESLL
ncbi:MAG: glycosyltransferase family 9 protein [Chlorobi bacterium]|nr:glycosyltransferase family 9 protein [Chlorobiota bacterium]